MWRASDIRTILGGALIHRFLMCALSQATMTKDPLFLSGATSKESAENTLVFVGWSFKKIAVGVMEVIRQNRNIRNMRCQNGNAKAAQQGKLITARQR